MMMVMVMTMKEKGSGVAVRGESITRRESSFLSSVGRWRFVRSFCCHVMDSNTTGKQAKQWISCFFVLAHVFPLRLRGVIALGEVMAFHFLFSCDLSIFFHAHQS